MSVPRFCKTLNLFCEFGKQLWSFVKAENFDTFKDLTMEKGLTVLYKRSFSFTKWKSLKNLQDFV